MRRALLAPAALLATSLTACSSLYEGNENSPFFLVRPGSRVTLNQELAVPGQDVSVFIQDGRVLAFPEVKKYYPHCKFELHTKGTVARKVTTDEFGVTKVVQEESHSAALGTIMLAQSGFGESDDGPSVRAFATRLYLKSARQPEVFRLSCAQWGHPPYDRHVTIAEMRRALGSLMTLQLAPPPSR